MATPVPELTSHDELTALVRARTPLILWFGATWCGPCRRLKTSAHLITETAKSAGFEIYYCDVDENRETAEAMNIRSIPTFVRLEPGKAPVAITESYTHAVQEFINYKTLEAAQRRS